MITIKLTRVLLVLIAVATIVSFFLPYFVFDDYGKAMIELGADIKPYESVNMTGKDMSNLSLFTYSRLYFPGGKEILGSSGEGIFYGILYCLVPFFGLLVLIFGLTGKGIPSLIFSILLAGDAYLIHLDFIMRGVISNNNLTTGIGYYLIYICAALMFIVSICMIVSKHKLKKRQTA